MNAFQQWIVGLLSAGISATAMSVTVGIADPATFNLNQGLPKLGIVCGLTALLHMAAFLQRSPLWITPAPPASTK